jgi:ABC-type transport system involved in multi-copper enzyme maturation permease subunit
MTGSVLSVLARSAATSPLRKSAESRPIRLIAGKEFCDRFRSGWVIACIAVWLGAICLTSFLGLIQLGHIGAQGYERTVISLLNLVQYLVPLLGLLLGHDLIVSEREERTLQLILASGVSRSRLLLGKFLGGCLTLAVPLVAGFLIAGTAIGLAAKDNAFAPFIRLALSGLGLGILFVALGLTISVWCRNRTQALVLALLAWCFFVFVFDLVGLGLLISTQSPAAAREIELVCDATHVNAAADIHSALESGAVATSQAHSASNQHSGSIFWPALNPVDLFRVINLTGQTGIQMPFFVTLGICGLWLALAAVASLFKFQKIDL